MAKILQEEDKFIFECPGCGCFHFFNDSWQFNGDFEKPTVSPSIRVRQKSPEICHFFIRDGKIQYCSDSMHELAGQTVEMIDIDK